MAITAILFDLDDTLISEMDFVREGWTAVAEYLSPRTERTVKELEAMAEAAFAVERAHVYDQMCTQLGLGRGLVADCVEIYRTHRCAVRLLDDAVAALAWASDRPTAIVSDGRADVQRNKVNAAGLDRLVDAVILTDELGPGMGKPSPAGFQLALKLLNVSAPEAIYVADNPAKDFLGPRRIGMCSAQIRRDDGVHANAPTIPGGSPDGYLESLYELPALVEHMSDPALSRGAKSRIEAQ